jgi:hypothetical protein
MLPPHEGGDPWWNERRVFSRWEAWFYLFANASFAGHEWVLTNGGIIKLQRGETRPLSIRYLTRAWGWKSKRRVSAFINWNLSRCRLRVRQRTSDGDTYFVVKYEQYQTSGDSGGDSIEYGEGDSGGYSGGTKEKQEKARESKRKKKDHGSDADFERAWAAYPKRAGGNPKARARAAWNARIREGADPEAIIAGVERYRQFVDATDAAGTQFVKQAATFLGPDRHWEEDWAPPADAAGAAEDAFAEQMERDFAAIAEQEAAERRTVHG